MNTFETAAAEVARAYESACRSHDNVLDAECAQAMRDAAPGQSVKLPNKTSGEYRSQASESIIAARDEALTAIAKARRANNAALVAAPSMEASNYILSIQGRDDLSESEVRAALERYSGHAAQSAILAAAKRSGVKTYGYVSSDEELTATALDDMEREVMSRFSIFHIEDASPGMRSMTKRGFENKRPGQSFMDEIAGAFNA